MMTVVVSIVAGVFAIGSGVPLGEPITRCCSSIGFVMLITLANLRGAKESGTVFAIPTYGVRASSIYVLLSWSACAMPRRLPGGGARSSRSRRSRRVPRRSGCSLILQAFSSGATALTGVEAISDGVPAFRRPQAKNAAATLAIMGVIAITMFLGISCLATHMHGVDRRASVGSVVAQIAHAVFGDGSSGSTSCSSSPRRS